MLFRGCGTTVAEGYSRKLSLMAGRKQEGEEAMSKEHLSFFLFLFLELRTKPRALLVLARRALSH